MKGKRGGTAIGEGDAHKGEEGTANVEDEEKGVVGVAGGTTGEETGRKQVWGRRDRG